MANLKRNSGVGGNAGGQGFLCRLRRDKAGNVLAIGVASTFAMMGMIGGAVDMSRAYMVKSRLQQACDAGALAARKNMGGETLTNDNKNVGYRFFDFIFPSGSLGATLTSRVYTQPVNAANTPQAIVNGTVVASVPTTIMRVFGNQSIAVNVTCSSKMEISNADVAMVLDVTGSMATDMKIRTGSNDTEDRIVAMRKAVRAFYNALGPGRAAGDLSKGRIRYAIIPYGTVVNVGYLLNHDQMVSSWTYQSREVRTVYGWHVTGEESTGSYGGWAPTAAPPLAQENSLVSTNYGSFGTGTVGTGNSTSLFTYTKLDGTTATLPRSVAGATSANCASNNNLVVGQTALTAVGQRPDNSVESNSDTAPIYPATTRARTTTNSRNVHALGLRYRWFNSGGNACRLESAVGNATTRWSQAQSKNTTRPVAWTTYNGAVYYGPRVIDVSALKGSGGTWNSTVTVPALNYSGSLNLYEDVRLSGTTNRIDLYAGAGPVSVDAVWRGCIEERKMINTITGATPLDTIPAGANDLDSTLLASSSDDDTRWRPWLQRVVYGHNYVNPVTADECPAPALKLQEIGNYDTTVLTSNYPMLFDDASGGPSSYYYPYTSSLWTGSGTAAERSRNIPTLRNYIDRITMTDGTTHDAGFIWGLHLVSGEGMFAAENPDRFNGQIVSRNIVFMTDGEMNPGEERYVYSGYNQYDGRVAPASSNDSQMKVITNRRLRIQCEAAKRQGITVWVVAITDGTPQDFTDLRACASSSSNYKSAATSEELIATFTTIAQSIGGLRISQ